jgi:hypothetical protein
MYLSSPEVSYEIVYWHHDLQVKKRTITKTLIEDIALSVFPSGEVAKLKYDIIKKGLLHPIIVIDNSKYNYNMAIRQVSKDLLLPFDSNKPLLAYTGNQRIVIARKWKYSYISTIIMPDVHWAHAAQLHIQNGKIDNRDRRQV